MSWNEPEDTERDEPEVDEIDEPDEDEPTALWCEKSMAHWDAADEGDLKYDLAEEDRLEAEHRSQQLISVLREVGGVASRKVA